MFVNRYKLVLICVDHSLKTDIFGSLYELPKITRKTGKSMVLKARILFLLLVVFWSFKGMAQVSFDSPEELEKAANEFFDASDYAKAKPLFSQLLSKDAMNPDYNYRFGVCILFTEADPLKPLPYIEGGANSKGVNIEAHYFLGKALQFNYRFDDAIASYQKAKNAGLNKPNIDLDRSIEECRNGKILYNPAIDFQPAQDKEVIASEFYRPYDFRKLKGKVIPMPPDFKTKYDLKNLTGTVIYTPTNSQTLVYASYGEDGANAKDLYRINRLPSGELALPLRLPSTINTKYDEDYAFFDEESQILFFASKGHNSMGGYDIFSSKYDPNTSNWSTPLNLQYPINSPYDDFLYVSDPDGKVAFFTSQRNVEAGKLRVLKTLLHDPQQVEVSVVEGTFEDLTDSVYNYAALTVLDPLTNEVVGKYRSHKVTGKYLLILPPQNGYKMDVGPREADGFKFDLDVPTQESIRPLQQGIVYNAEGDKGTVTLTNYFDGTGKPDSIAFAKSRSLSEVEEQMVAMPDPTEILAAKSQASNQNQKAEELALAEKAKKDSLKQAEELALKTKQAAEEATRQAELAKTEKAKQDSLKQAEELALKERQAADEAARKTELANAKKAKLDSLKNEELALKKKEAEEEAEKPQEVAKAKQAELNSTRVAEQAALARLEKEAIEKFEQLRKDSLKQVEELALQQEKAEDKLVNAERIQAESIREAEKKALAISAQEAAAKAEIAKQDSLNEAAQFALQEKKAKAETEQTDLVQQALEKARQDSVREVDALNKLREQHLAQRAKRDSINKAIELAKIKEEKEKVFKDSIAAVELAIEQERETKLDLLNDRKDILTQIKEIEIKAELLAEKERLASLEGKDTEIEKAELAKANEQTIKDSVETEKLVQEVLLAEKERIATIDREVELAKQKAMKDSLIQPELANQEEAPSHDDLLKEMAEKEAEILNETKSIEKEIEPISRTNEVAVIKPTAIDTTTSEVVELAQTSKKNKTLTETKTLSESELFLQTIAKMEAQKKEQEKLITNENEMRKKAQEEQKLTLAEAKKVADTTATKTETTTNSILSADKKAVADTSDIETMSVALKSDANPAEYLVALNKIEDEIAKDAAANKGKNYELQELPATPAANRKVVEPALQVKIDADRKALAEHQIIAAEKEKALNEQMQRDKVAVESIDQAAEVEIAAIENEILEDLHATKEVIRKDTSDAQPVIATKGNAKAKKEEVSETKEVTPTSAEQEVLDALAAFDAILDKTENVEDNQVAIETQPVTTEPQKQVETEELVEKVIESKTEVIEPITEEQLTEKVVEAELVEEVAVAEDKLVEPSSPVKPIPAPKPVVSNLNSQDGIGQIPFMNPALRDYSKRKPSFDKIENPTTRRMIKRMRSEDIGRIAVLKNMKNEWVDAGKTAESLNDIKGNIRNQDVLESAASAPSIEEFIRPPFDKNTLKKRQDVHYKLEIKIVTNSVSETISETMSPEQAISFAMPEFDVQSGYYQTLADATSDYKEFMSRGFESVKIIPYLKNEPVRLSDVTEVPFID